MLVGDMTNRPVSTSSQKITDTETFPVVGLFFPPVYLIFFVR